MWDADSFNFRFSLFVITLLEDVQFQLVIRIINCGLHNTGFNYLTLIKIKRWWVVNNVRLLALHLGSFLGFPTCPKMAAVVLRTSLSHIIIPKAQKEGRCFLIMSPWYNCWGLSQEHSGIHSWAFDWLELGHMGTHSCKGSWEARNQKTLFHYLRMESMIYPDWRHFAHPPIEVVLARKKKWQ